MKYHQNVAFWSNPNMPYVETRKACQSRICYKSHSHPTFSIGAVDAGISRFTSSFADEQEITVGNLVVIPAHVDHSCNPLPEHDWSYQMMHIDAQWLSQLLQETKADLSSLSDLNAINLDATDLDALTSEFPLFKPRILKDQKIYQSFTLLNETLFDPNKSILEKEQLFLATLINILLPNLKWERIEISQYAQQFLPKLKQYLERDIENLSLQELANEVGISRYALIRLFKQYFGQTPHAFQLNRKMNQARQFLKEGRDIAQLAYDLEFTDQSHFQRVFKQYTGVTPKQFIKS